MINVFKMQTVTDGGSPWMNELAADGMTPQGEGFSSRIVGVVVSVVVCALVTLYRRTPKQNSARASQPSYDQHEENQGEEQIIYSDGLRDYSSSNKPYNVYHAEEGYENEAMEVCHRLREKELSIADLGNTPQLKHYVMLRDFAPSFLQKAENRTKLLRHAKEKSASFVGDGGEQRLPLLGRRVVMDGLLGKPELNGRTGMAVSFDDDKGRYSVEVSGTSSSLMIKPSNLSPAVCRASEDLMIIAYLADVVVDGGSWESGEGHGDRVYKILFTDASDQRFFSLGAENGHFRGNAANLFLEFLCSRKYQNVNLDNGFKIVEDLMVLFSKLVQREGGVPGMEDAMIRSLNATAGAMASGMSTMARQAFEKEIQNKLSAASFLGIS